MAMAKIMIRNNSATELKHIVERIEQFEREKRDITDNINDVLSHAKGDGFDVKTIRHVLKIRKIDALKLAEQQALLDTYLTAIAELDADILDDEPVAPKRKEKAA
jgi:uncharacterized protein (UPF0335 family)